MIQLVGAFATKPDDLVQSSESTWLKERLDFSKLSFDVSLPLLNQINKQNVIFFKISFFEKREKCYQLLEFP